MASTHKSLRSSTADKRPTTAIADGQLAINTNAASAGLFFKDSTGASIIKIGPVHVGTTAPNASPAAGGSSGNSTGEVWLDTSLTPVGVKIWNGTAWVNATPAGSTTVQGLLELATNAETQTGSDTARAVTPAGLQSKISDSVSTTSSTTIASSTAVKAAYDLAATALTTSGGTITGNLEIGTTGSLTFEGTTADGFETTLAVVDPTADRTITLPNITGTVITTGDTGTVTSTMIADGTIVNADIDASAAIVDSKLATISTAGKVANSATTATDANTPSTIVARDASGNFTAGTITATGFSGSGASLTSLTAGNLSGTIPSGVLGNSSLFVGTTSVALNRASASQALTGILSVAMPGATSGTITVTPASVAGTTAITIPATSGTLITTGDTATVSNTMLATISTAGKVSGGAITSGTIGGSTAISTSGAVATTGTLAVGQSSAATNTDFDLAGTYAQTVVAVGALDIDCSTGNYFTKTINGNSTFTVSNVPASRAYAFTLELTHTSGTVTWFSGVQWPGGTAPTLTTGKTHLFMFVTDDGGTRWRASSLINYTN